MTFREKVLSYVKQIPYGHVTSYGYIALLVGQPRAARQVGFALRSLGLDEQDIPWWRVVNKKGYISIEHGEGGIEKERQQELLRLEGVEVNDYIVDMFKFGWTKG